MTLLLLLTAGSVSAQDVSIELKTKDGRTEYRIGEPIYLQLVFTSTSPLYIVDSSFRHPEMSHPKDEFSVEPREGWSDPFKDYKNALLNNPMGWFDGGGLRGYGKPSDKPVELELFLNRNVRFEKPGRYSVVIRDHRVSVAKSRNDQRENLELTTKPLELVIVEPEEGWQERQLSAALDAIRNRTPLPNVNACEALQSLGTPTAELAMVDTLDRNPDQPGCVSLLDMLGAKNRELILQEMEKVLKSPTGRVGPVLLESIASLRSLEDGNGYFYQRVENARQEIGESLYAALDEKKGAARIAAIGTLVNQSLMSGENGGGGDQKHVLHLAAEIFEQLSPSAQVTLLSARWKDVASAAMIPALKRCAQATLAEPCGQLQGDLLLTRLNELSPADARAVILTQIRQENARFPAAALSILPDKELPEMDALLQERLESRSGNLYTTTELIGRYATKGLASVVERFLQDPEGNGFHGALDAELIAYLLRVEPEIGGQAFKDAIRRRADGQAKSYLLSEVARKVSSPAIQEYANEALFDHDYMLSQSATGALRASGDEKAKAVLFARLEQWRQSWRGREDEIQWFTGIDPVEDDRLLGDHLIQAIAQGDGWILNQEDQRRLLQCAVKENQKEQIRGYIRATNERPVSITVLNIGSPQIQISIGQYSFEAIERAKRKILQFPAGTSFVLQAVPGQSDESKRASEDLKSFLAEHEMRIEAGSGQ